MGVYNVSVISNPEFINLEPSDISPLVSKCEIKICYVGKNRNGSFISKEVATEMSKTLKCCPIVGWFKKDKDDFRDHGREITFNGEGINVKCNTVPYGFVSPDAKVWFQKFSETDENGETKEREYLMTTGYLWTKQFPECQKVYEEGRPQSMELDDETLEGYWAKKKNEEYEFFIVTDAIFSKICILGNDVEPCFEGANITAPNVSKDFTKTLYSMMQELTFALKSKGESELKKEDVLTETKENPSADFSTSDIEPVVEQFSNSSTDHACDEDKKKKFEKDNEDEKKEKDQENKDSKSSSDEKESKEDDENKKKYSLLEQKYQELENKFSAIVNEYQQLKEFKNTVESQRKDELIAEFYMLSDEDKADVIAHKNEYSYDEIDAKLSVICRKRKVNFSVSPLDASVEDTVPTTFTCESSNDVNCFESELISAIRATKAARDTII